MADRKFNALVSRLKGLVAGRDAALKGDAALLQEFLDHGAQASFASLVQRHGPMVLGVCRRVMSDAHEAEDVFQAVFLVLARQRRNICWGSSLGGWLYRVAYLLALKARHRSARRAAHERRAADMDPARGTGEDSWAAGEGRNPDGDCRSPSSPPAEAAGREARAALEEELSRLPHRYRSPVVLCCLEGKTYEDAARELGWPTLTVKGQLARARGLLRERLARRGFALSAGGVGAALSEQLAAAALPPGAADTTAAAAAAFAAGQMTGAVSAPAAALASEMLRGLAMSRRAAVVLMVLGGLGVAGAAYRLLPAHADAPASKAAAPEAGPRKATLSASLTGHAGNIYAVTYSPDGRTMASGSGDRTVKLWNTGSGRELASLPGHNFTVHRVAFSADGKTLASATAHPSQPTITLWDIATRKPLGSLTGNSRPLCLTFGGAGETLVAVYEDMVVKWWDVRTRQASAALTLQRAAGPGRCVAYSPTARSLAIGDSQGKVWLGDVDFDKRPSGRGAVPRLLALAPRVYSPPASPWFAQPLAFSPDGRKLVVVTPDATVSLCDVATKTSTLVPCPRKGIPLHVAFSADGQFLAIGGKTTTWEVYFFTLWEMAGAREQMTLTGPDANAGVVLAFEPHGHQLALAAKDGIVDLWQLPVGQSAVAGP